MPSGEALAPDFEEADLRGSGGAETGWGLFHWLNLKYDTGLLARPEEHLVPPPTPSALHASRVDCASTDIPFLSPT
jgi:hypothetical protein